MRRLGALIIVALVIGAGLPGQIRGAFPGADGRIASIDPDQRIQVMDPDGGNLILGPSASAATWSPGGSMLTFLSGSTVYAVDSDGSHQRVLISLPHAFVYEFAWSPDGSRLVYTAFDPAGVGQKELFIVSVDGGAPRRLTYRPQNDMEPAWSPDGRWIAYTREVYHYGADFHITHEIWAIRPDRSEVRQLTTGENDTSADWAPDGTRVAFSRVGFDGGIYAVDPDGSDLAQIVPADWSGHAPPAWSPQGGHLAYGPSATDAELTIVTAAGALVATIGAGRRPDWQPIPEFPLVDARFSIFHDDIVWAHGAGVTVGCTAERYCPSRVVSRGELSAFLARLLDLPSTEQDFFTDDGGSPFEDDINRVAAAGIATGCGPVSFCPTRSVTREQAATFIANALELPGAVEDHFTDDDQSIHEWDINRLADAGIARGCTPTTFCPTRAMTRGEMAALLHRGFGPT